MVASAPRACVQLGANAAAEILEDFGPALGGSASFTNSVLEVRPLAGSQHHSVSTRPLRVSINHALALPWHPVHSASSHDAQLQVSLAEGAALQHGYVQLEAARGAAHTKSTLVRQAARSSYTLTEACLGGQLARHDVNVEQVCPLRQQALTSRPCAWVCVASLPRVVCTTPE